MAGAAGGRRAPFSERKLFSSPQTPLLSGKSTLGLGAFWMARKALRLDHKVSPEGAGQCGRNRTLHL